jgi:hypothetical protein
MISGKYLTLKMSTISALTLLSHAQSTEMSIGTGSHYISAMQINTYPVLILADVAHLDTNSRSFVTPLSGMEKILEPGSESGINISDHISESSALRIRILNGKNSDRDEHPDPHSATLILLRYCSKSTVESNIHYRVILKKCAELC